MRIKLVKLNNNIPGPLVVLVKEPRYFCEKVKMGEVMTVDDDLGHAILTAYPKCFKVLPDEASQEDQAPAKAGPTSQQAPVVPQRTKGPVTPESTT